MGKIMTCRGMNFIVMKRQMRWFNLSLLSLFLLVSCLRDQVYGQTVYFLVGEISPSHNDSYVLLLSDPCDIAHEFREVIGHKFERAAISPSVPGETILTST